MKRITTLILALFLSLGFTAACESPVDPVEQFKQDCQEQGGTVRSSMESDGESTYYCVMPGESFDPGTTQDD